MKKNEKQETVYLSLGSNLGDRDRNLEFACERLSKIVSGLKLSSVYETAPMYETNQGVFLNCVAAGLYRGEPETLLAELQHIEKQAGREKTYRNGPRVLDIDILLFGDRIVRKKHLVIPHPEIRKRQFVLVPLLEIVPDLRDPGTRELYSEILSKIEPQGVYFHSDSRYTGCS